MKIKSIRLKAAINFIAISLISIFTTVVVLSIFIHYRFQSLTLVWSSIFILTLSAVVVALCASWYLSKRMTIPINQMIEMVRKVGEGDFDHRVIITSDDELKDLADNLNSMTNQLKERMIESQEERAKVKSMLADVADGVIVTDSEGKIQLINPKAERLFGVEPEYTLGRTVIEISQNYQMQDLIESTLKGERTKRELEISFPRRKIVKVKTRPLRGPDKKIFGTITTFDDLTKVHNLIEARKDFTANVSHELRTPIASIKALAESLLAGAKDDPKKAQQFLEDINTETERLTFLINDILDLSRLESSESQIRKEDIDLADLALRVVERMRTMASKKSIELIVEDQSEPVRIKGDYDQIILAVSNLVNNAIKYTPEKGKVRIKLYTDEKHSYLSISDTGIGIPKKDIPRIFERFYVVDRARSRESGGTGLGLSIVKHIIENHRGKIKAKSTLGKGSDFIISLPKK